MFDKLIRLLMLAALVGILVTQIQIYRKMAPAPPTRQDILDASHDQTLLQELYNQRPIIISDVGHHDPVHATPVHLVEK